MITSKNSLIIALVFPIVALVALTAYKRQLLSAGYEVVLPISGYDPRDLLSGHFLIYRIDYGVPGICGEASERKEGYVCLEPKVFSYEPFEGCVKSIRGVCHYGRFEAGIEKYFVPEAEAARLDALVRANQAQIVLAVSGGRAQVKDLWIKGRSWRDQ